LGPKKNPYEFIKGVLDELYKFDIDKSFTSKERAFLEKVKTLFPGLEGEDLKKALCLPGTICRLSKWMSNLEDLLSDDFCKAVEKDDWPTFQALIQLLSGPNIETRPVSDLITQNLRYKLDVQAMLKDTYVRDLFLTVQLFFFRSPPTDYSNKEKMKEILGGLEVSDQELSRAMIMSKFLDPRKVSNQESP
jgi:hypothetical protein